MSKGFCCLFQEEEPEEYLSRRQAVRQAKLTESTKYPRNHSQTILRHYDW
jgi:hypothetical protein